MTSLDDRLTLPLEGWADFSDVAPPDARVLVGIAGIAVVTDLAVRSEVVGLAGALLVLLVAAYMLASGRIVNARAWPLIAAAPLFGVCLATRMSPWLLPLDILAAGGLLALGATFSKSGDPLNVTVPSLVGRGVHALVHGLLAPGFVLRGWGANGGRLLDGSRIALVRGLALAVPLVLVIGLLLASADAVFASFFRFPTNAGDITLHLVLLGVGAWGAAGLMRVASAAPFDMPATRRPVLGSVEWTTMLGALVGLFVAFAASQVIAVVRGSDYVVRTAGLTYAEYARSGFFQLLAVATISLAVLLVVRATVSLGTDAARRRFLLLSESVVVLTLVIVLVAIRRLHLYEQAYGLTMLRLCSVLVALWIGAVFVMLGLHLAGVGASRNWLVPAAVGLALAGLFATNLANPEAIVVRRNVDRFAATEKLDVHSLTLYLSDDGIPALVDSTERMRREDATLVRSIVCRGEMRATGGFWAWNASVDAAIEARVKLCRGR